MKKPIIENYKKSKTCMHDYKNAIKIGNIDYQCPLCGKLLDPNEWFFMNSFEFVDVTVKKISDSGRGPARGVQNDERRLLRRLHSSQ